jgi:hypothetical protein
MLHPGDTLAFEFSSRSYSLYAPLWGAPESPANVTFTFVTAPLDPAAQFSANLSSIAGDASVDFGAPLTFVPAEFHGAAYDGTVSALTGSLDLDPALSDRLFGSSAVILTLRNIGLTVTLGLPPYLFPQDFFVTLSGGPVRAGAAVSRVLLDPPDALPAPEPHPGPLLLGGGSLLCLISALLNRIAKRRIQSS